MARSRNDVPRKRINALMVRRVPDCTSSEAYRAWRSACYTSRPPSNTWFCTDCTPLHQTMMKMQGRCNHPYIKFRLDEDDYLEGYIDEKDHKLHAETVLILNRIEVPWNLDEEGSERGAKMVIDTATGKEKEIFCAHGQHMRPISDMRLRKTGAVSRWVCGVCRANIREARKERAKLQKQLAKEKK